MKLASFFLIALAVTASTAAAGSPKIAKDLEKVDRSATIEVIIQFVCPPTDKQHDKIRRQGGSMKDDLSSIKAASYSIPARQLMPYRLIPKSFILHPTGLCIDCWTTRFRLWVPTSGCFSRMGRRPASESLSSTVGLAVPLTLTTA